MALTLLAERREPSGERPVNAAKPERLAPFRYRDTIQSEGHLAHAYGYSMLPRCG
jgi:hypothetical protein